jgi:4-hydroxythreonine-4-phosphate dehydrogenase
LEETDPMGEPLPLAITMGDPAGVGPEIIAKALSDRGLRESCSMVLVGDLQVLKRAFELHAPGLEVVSVSTPCEVSRVLCRVSVCATGPLSEEILPGRPTLAGATSMVASIRQGVQMTLRGEVGGMVTCPISKAWMNRTGCVYDGHTELLAHLTGAEDYVMMLAGERLRVSLVTIHCALRDVPYVLTPIRVFKTILITGRALRNDFGISDPRIAVAALNPHAGECGLFGNEESEIIAPGIREAREAGCRAEGPLSPDTVFHRAASGEFDAVVAMYHDQGLIPIKLLHFSDAVNVTLGLPIVRTSVDHGTAYDIAGRGVADPSSLKAAIRLAAEIVRNREKRRGERAAMGADQSPASDASEGEILKR